jgi:hypothetical protein
VFRSLELTHNLLLERTLMFKKVLVSLAAIALSATGMTSVSTANDQLAKAGTVFFASGSAKLTPAAKQTLKAIASNYVEVNTFVITGYVQKTSNTDNDFSLSKARALRVKKFLRNVGGSPAMITIAYGVTAKNSTAAQARKVVVAYNQQELDVLPDLSVTNIYGNDMWACAMSLVVDNGSDDAVTKEYDAEDGDGECVGSGEGEAFETVDYTETFANLTPGTYELTLSYVANPYEVSCFDFTKHQSIRGWYLDSCTAGIEDYPAIYVTYTKTVEILEDTTVIAPNLLRVIVGANWVPNNPN